ncbi:MAG: DUF2058 domain-containing protein [Thiotrichaceae bacterium]|nr:DUF2058 domain-containing protein [Thiotrichaceae bacterium]
MAGSLQDQLLGAGLSNEKKAKKINVDKRRKAKKSRQNKTELINEAAELADKAIVAEKEKSQQLNKEIKEQAEHKAYLAQIKQLVALNTIKVEASDRLYNFVDKGKVKTLAIDAQIQKALGVGQLAIVCIEEEYQLIPMGIADKIKLRDEESIIPITTDSDFSESAEDDPYADYQIPDDLIW